MYRVSLSLLKYLYETWMGDTVGKVPLVFECQESLHFRWQNRVLDILLKSKNLMRVTFWLTSNIMIVIIRRPGISLSTQLLLFNKNEYEGVINLTSLALISLSVTAVLGNSVCNLFFRKSITLIDSFIFLILIMYSKSNIYICTEAGKIVEAIRLTIQHEKVKLNMETMIISQIRPCIFYFIVGIKYARRLLVIQGKFRMT